MWFVLNSITPLHSAVHTTSFFFFVSMSNSIDCYFNKDNMDASSFTMIIGNRMWNVMFVTNGRDWQTRDTTIYPRQERRFVSRWRARPPLGLRSLFSWQLPKKNSLGRHGERRRWVLQQQRWWPSKEREKGEKRTTTPSCWWRIDERRRGTEEGCKTKDVHTRSHRQLLCT